MGQAGKKRACLTYNWASILPQYDDLWRELSEIRNNENQKKSFNNESFFGRMDPFKTFSHYASRQLEDDTLLSLVDQSIDEAVSKFDNLSQLSMLKFSKYINLDRDSVILILNKFKNKSITAFEAIDDIPEDKKLFTFRSLNWLIKIGVLRIEE